MTESNNSEESLLNALLGQTSVPATKQETTQTKETYQLPVQVGISGKALSDGDRPWVVGHFSPGVATDVNHPHGHNGVDLKAARGTSVYPIASGIVKEVGTGSVSGNFVTCLHEDGRVQSFYGHLDSILAQKGQKINQTTIIGKVGSSGNAINRGSHCHIEVKINGSLISLFSVVGKLVGSLSKRAMLFSKIEKLAHKFSKYAIHIEELLLNQKDFLMKMGIDVSSLKMIGKGGNGIAYLMPNGKVLKTTTDSNELWASQRLINKNSEHLITIYNVIDFTYTPGWDKWNNGNFGIIIQDQITPISGEDKNQLELGINLVISSLPDDGEDFSYPFHKSWRVIENMKSIPGEEEKFKMGLSILKDKFKFDEVMRELNRAGIKVDDFHSGNFGKNKNGNYVLFDIGGPNVKLY